ncbi:unnamed protein product [Spirodela intermedia]|uniref:Uncharacterized protein n=1 Tax=Spirodela intermedia TaxID=51605 RepID=A0ABN7EAG9_SPIIN|nr:unnamed protein product [Spirodela intermedia]
MISPSCFDGCGRGWRPHAGASLVDPLLIAPREETHDCCYWPTYGVCIVAPRERGVVGCRHSKRGTCQRREKGGMRGLIVNEGPS